MNSQPPRGPDSLPLSRAWQVDKACDKFEDAWKKGDQRPRIEDFLGDTPEPERAELLRELVRLDAHYRRQGGLEPESRPVRPDSQETVPQAPPVAVTTATKTALPGGKTSSTARFRPLRFHKEGGLGEVHLAEDSELHREVAFKRIREKYADDPDSRQRFLREAEITGGLEHPGIVPVYGLGQYPDGRPFYAMRFIRGDSLKEAIDRFHKAEAPSRDPGERTLALRELLGRFVAVCNAVAYAHSRGVLHRDLKPGNVMLGPYGETLVVDWGLAKPVGRPEDMKDSAEVTLRPPSAGGSTPTQMGQAMGTPQYMPPEQAAGRLDELGPASDVYSLGATLYCLLTGKAPFEKVGGDPVLERVKRGEFPPPRLVKPTVPAALEAICLKAMAMRPEARYVSARAVADEIEHWLADEPVRAYPEPLGLRVGRWCRRHRALVTGLVVALLVVLAGTGAFGWWYQEEQARQAAEQAEREKTQALRLAGVERDVGVALRQATTLADRASTLTDQPPQWESTLAAAFSALALAESQLAKEGEAAKPAQWRQLRQVKARLEQAKRDFDMSIGLEETYLGKLALDPNSELDLAKTEKKYREAFRNYGLNVEALAPEQGARGIKESAIREQLIAALDDWLMVKKKSNAKDRERLLALIQHADESVMRRRIRAAREGNRGAELMSLVQEVLKKKVVPANTTLLLGLALSNRGAKEEAVRVLEQGQRRHPADVWLNAFLGTFLRDDPRRKGEALGYFRAALAARPESAFLHTVLGEDLDNNGDLEGAIAVYKEAIRLKRDYPLAQDKLGFALTHKGDLMGAIVAYKEAIRLKNDNPSTHYFLGTLLEKKGDLMGAIVAYNEAIHLEYDQPAAHLSLGSLYIKRGDLNAAIAVYKDAIRVKGDPGIYYSLGLALSANGELEEAIAAYKKAIRLKSDDPETYSDLGLALFKKGEVQEAIAAFREAIRLKKDFPEANKNLGIALAKKGDLEGAIAAFKEAIRLKKDDPEAHYQLGKAVFDRGADLEGAIAAFKEVISLKKDEPHAHYSLGIALNINGDPKGAIAAFKEAIYLKKDYPEAHYNLGLALFKNGDPEGAVTAFKEAIRLKKDFSGAHYALGLALFDGDLQGAIAAFKEAIHLKKAFPEAHYDLGLALFKKGDLEEAITAFREAIRLKKDYAEAHYNLGIALSENWDLEEAIAAFKEAIRLKKDYPEAHSNLGFALFKNGNPDGAIAAYKEAIRLKKDYPEAYCLMGLGLLSQGRFQQALEAMRTGHRLGSKDPKWNQHSAECVRLVERTVELDRKLPALLEGKAKVATAAEALELADVCRYKRYYAAAARFAAEAFAHDPKLAEDLSTGYRYNAAFCAALAGCGQAKDPGKLDEKEQGGWRKQAVAWLNADLALRAKQLEGGKRQDRATVKQQLRQWQRDADLAGIRERGALAKLPKEEQETCRKLWADVAALLKKAAGKR